MINIISKKCDTIKLYDMMIYLWYMNLSFKYFSYLVHLKKKKLMQPLDFEGALERFR